MLSPFLGMCMVAVGLLSKLQGSQEADVPQKLFSELSSGKEGDLGKERERGWPCAVCSFCFFAVSEASVQQATT